MQSTVYPTPITNVVAAQAIFANCFQSTSSASKKKKPGYQYSYVDNLYIILFLNNFYFHKIIKNLRLKAFLFRVEESGEVK